MTTFSLDRVAAAAPRKGSGAGHARSNIDLHEELTRIAGATPIGRGRPRLFRDAAQCVALFVALSAAVFCSELLWSNAAHIPAFWPANAILLSVLLRAAIPRWPYYVAIGLIAYVAPALVDQLNQIEILVFAGIHVAEATLAAAALRALIGSEIRFAAWGQSLGFMLLAAVLAPAVGATAAVAVVGESADAGLAPVWLSWWFASAMGVLVVSPALLTVSARSLTKAISLKWIAEATLLLAAAAVIASFAFGRSDLIALSLTFPVLLWAGYRFGVLGVSASGTVVTIIAIWITDRGAGPISGLLERGPGANVWLTEVFLATAVFSALAVATMLGERDAATAELERRWRGFRVLIDHSLDIIFLLDCDGRITFATPSAEAVLGRPRAAFLGTVLSDLVHPDDLEEARETVAKLCAGSGKTMSFELRLRRADGTWRILDTVARNLLDDPDIAGIVVNAHDVTDRRAVEERIHESQRLEVIGQLTGGVAHDFNNLLTVIQINSEMIYEQIEGKQDLQNMGDMIGAILKSTHRGSELVAHLLAFARQQVLQATPTDLNKLVENSTHLMRRTLGETISVKVYLESPLWPVALDQAQMESALLNLAVNARDAMPSGGELKIATCNVEVDENRLAENPDMKRREYVMVTVADTGTGMPPDILEHVFEPFFTTKEFGRGSGLGLSMVYGFVKQSGGHVRVSSEPGHGTSFHLYFPSAA